MIIFTLYFVELRGRNQSLWGLNRTIEAFSSFS